MKGGWKALRDKLPECWKEVGGKWMRSKVGGGRREVGGRCKGGYRDW